MEGRAEFVVEANRRIDLALECVRELHYPFQQLAFSIILEYLIQDMDCGEEQDGLPLP